MHERILVVEDEPDIIHIELQVLKTAGYQVIVAYGAEDALKKVQQHKIDLILTDLEMPKISGVEVIQEVKRNLETKHIPVIAVTAHTWEPLAQSAGQVGCDAFISKPFNNRQLVLEVQKQLDKRSRPS